MEYYKKVEIKSEKDLPKKESKYIIRDDTSGKIYELHFDPNNPKDIYDWLKYFNWYLQPITKEEYDKQVAFEATSNPDLIEAQTNYRLYQEKIDGLTELMEAYKKLIPLEGQYYLLTSEDIKKRKKLRQRITELRKGLGL